MSLHYCNAVIVGQTKSLDFLEEEKKVKNSKSQAAATVQNQQQFQCVSVACCHPLAVSVTASTYLGDKGIWQSLSLSLSLYLSILMAIFQLYPGLVYQNITTALPEDSSLENLQQTCPNLSPENGPVSQEPTVIVIVWTLRVFAPCGLCGWKNKPATFPGRMS